MHILGIALEIPTFWVDNWLLIIHGFNSQLASYIKYIYIEQKYLRHGSTRYRHFLLTQIL